MLKYAQGPDFKKGILNTQHASLVDLHATIRELLQLQNSQTEGHVMFSLFKIHYGFTKRNTPRAPEDRL